MWKRWASWLAGVLAAVVVLAIAWVLVGLATDWIAAHDAGPVTGPLRTLRLQTAREAARGLLLTFVAVVFAAGALIFTGLSFRRSRPTFVLPGQEQVTDRFTKAIEQLGSDKPEVRIGAINALERIARDSARYHPTVMEALARFVRDHSGEPRPLPLPGADTAEDTLAGVTIRPDVQAALTVVGRRNPRTIAGSSISTARTSPVRHCFPALTCYGLAA